MFKLWVKLPKQDHSPEMMALKEKHQRDVILETLLLTEETADIIEVMVAKKNEHLLSLFMQSDKQANSYIFVSYMVANNNIEGLEWLLSNGVDINGQWDRYDNETPLFLMAERASVHEMDILVRYGAAINQQNNRGETPLYSTIRSGKMGHFKFLLFRNAVLFPPPIVNNGIPQAVASLVAVALENRRFAIAEQLLEWGAPYGDNEFIPDHQEKINDFFRMISEGVAGNFPHLRILLDNIPARHNAGGPP